MTQNRFEVRLVLFWPIDLHKELLGEHGLESFISIASFHLDQDSPHGRLIPVRRVFIREATTNASLLVLNEGVDDNSVYHPIVVEVVLEDCLQDFVGDFP